MRGRSDAPAPGARLVGVMGLLAALLAGCSGQASTRAGAAAGGPATTAAQVSARAAVPPGTTLRLGDQLDFLENLLERAGENRDLPYRIEWANFVGGPPMLQAFKGGSLDAGFVASTPLLFASAQGQAIVAVAGWAPERGATGLLAVDDRIRSWGDLRGRRVAYQRGTSLEAGLLLGLASAGLRPTDITTVDVPYSQLNATLESGSADAAMSAEPLISAYVQGHPGARTAVEADTVTDKANFLIAHADALGDPARAAALADLTARLVRAVGVHNERPELRTASYQTQYGLPPERARALAERSGRTTFLRLPDDIVPAQQTLSRLFHEAGQIPREVDVTTEFDARFTDLIAEEARR